MQCTISFSTQFWHAIKCHQDGLLPCTNITMGSIYAEGKVSIFCSLKWVLQLWLYSGLHRNVTAFFTARIF